MTQFESFQAMDIEQLTDWIDSNGQFDNSPWMLWFDEQYCSKCPSIMTKYEDGILEFPCSWCEINGNCKYFPKLSEAPGNREIIKMWLERKINK